MPSNFPLMRNNILRSDLDAVIDHLQQDDPILTNGPKVKEFEAEWSKWLGVKYSVFVNSGASANLLSMAVLRNLHPDGGEVLLPSLTWSSDVSSIIHCGFKPVFVDIDPRTLAMKTDETLSKVTDKTRAVFLTHAQGFNGLSDELIEQLNKLNIPLIEDVCESHGASHKGVKAGAIGWMSNFSFYYAHHMSTIEGGMVCTNDERVYELVRMLRSHGMVREASNQATKDKWQAEYPDLNPEFIFAHTAYNVRNTEIGAILGLEQLKRLDSIVSARTENLKYFLEKLDSSIYETDFELEGSSNYAFNIVLKEANTSKVTKLMSLMSDAGIEFRRGSAGGGNQVRQPYVQRYVKEDAYKDFPVTDHIHFYGFYIGNFPDLSFGEIDDITTILNQL